MVVGGTLAQHKGINAPDVELPASALTDKDIADLRFGARLGVDMVALSFVQTVEDLQRTRASSREAGAPGHAADREDRAAAGGRQPRRPCSARCDGVMVARGDLGNEVPLHSVPRAQKVITQLRTQAGMPVIVATQVLESMRTNPRPTRAEVSDAANAVDDSVDAVMLSGETASGSYPGGCGKLLDAVIRDAESLSRQAARRLQRRCPWRAAQPRPLRGRRHARATPARPRPSSPSHVRARPRACCPHCVRSCRSMR